MHVHRVYCECLEEYSPHSSSQVSSHYNIPILDHLWPSIVCYPVYYLYCSLSSATYLRFVT